MSKICFLSDWTQWQTAALNLYRRFIRKAHVLIMVSVAFFGIVRSYSGFDDCIKRLGFKLEKGFDSRFDVRIDGMSMDIITYTRQYVKHAVFSAFSG